MSTPESPFTIAPVPANLSGARTIRLIESAAHEDEPIIPLLWPRTSNPETATNIQNSEEEEAKEKEINEAENLEEDTRVIDFLKDPSNHYLLVTETESGKDVAFVWWQQLQGRTEEEWAETYRIRYGPEGMNKALMDTTSGVRFLKRAKLLNTQEIFMLKELYVRPEFQRKGLGERLVELGMKKADELGLSAYTEASEKGLGLYLRHGFEEVDRESVNLEPWGGKKREVNSYGLLLRETRGKVE